MSISSGVKRNESLPPSLFPWKECIERASRQFAQTTWADASEVGIGKLSKKNVLASSAMNVSKGCCFFSAHSFFVVKRNKSVEDTLLIFGHQEVTFDKLLLMTLYISCKHCRHQVSSTCCFQILRPSKNVFLFSFIGCVIFARWRNCVAEIFLGKKWITAAHCFAQRIISPPPTTLSSPICRFIWVLEWSKISD